MTSAASAGSGAAGWRNSIPTTGLALPWNPDVAGVLSGGSLIPGVNAIEIGADGNLYAVLGVFLYSNERAVAAGQLAPPTLAYSTTTGRRLPWRPSAPGMIAVQPDCLLTAAGVCRVPSRRRPIST